MSASTVAEHFPFVIPAKAGIQLPFAEIETNGLPKKAGSPLKAGMTKKRESKTEKQT